MRSAATEPRNQSDLGTAGLGMSRNRALATAAALSAVCALGFVYPASPEQLATNGATTGVASDAAMYETVVTKLKSGAPYYPTLGYELRSRGYPTLDGGSGAFNWRTPLHLRSLALVPYPVGRGALTGLLVAMFIATMLVVGRRPSVRWAAGALQVGVIVVGSAKEAVYVSEAWAGLLIGVSVCLYSLRRVAAAQLLGLLALFVRELAAPYCVACTIMALHKRRWREAGGWLVGAALYAAYYSVHVLRVMEQRLPGDFAHDQSWLRFGGLPFLQAAIGKMSWLAILPDYLTPLVLALIAGGLLNTNAPRELRVAVGVFAVFFAAAGQPFNAYWGWTTAPIFAIATAYGIQTLQTVATTLASAEWHTSGPITPAS